VSSESPSASLLANLRRELAQAPPFSQMDAAALDFFLSHAQEHYFAPGETVLQPAGGAVRQLFYIRRGAVTRGAEAGPGAVQGPFEHEAGDLFPVGAALAERPVTATYSADGDTFVLALPLAAMRELAGRSAPFSAFLNRRLLAMLELSRQRLQVAFASRALAEQSLDSPLAQLARRSLVSCRPEAPLQEVLTQMHTQGTGSMLVTSEAGIALGILTRHDILARVTLPAVPLSTPVAQVMVRPVHSLTGEQTAQDAALLMSRYGIRHVPVTRDGVAVGMVSERDLFALQRFSLKGISTALRAAGDAVALRALAGDVRAFASNLLGQGVQARQLTALVSHLNDVLTRRLLELKAREHGIEMDRLCWLALGSEGRAEQTIATDQDNALILPDGTAPAQREQIRAFAHAVNLELDACGYPLCKGGVMAGEPACCRTLGEWRELFAGWIDHGDADDLLNASIYFDFRALAGDEEPARLLRREVAAAARANPRFLKQLAGTVNASSAPINWRGAIAVDEAGTVDLKLQGTAIFVAAARLYGLAQGVAATGTRERLEAAGTALGVQPTETGGWVAAFEFLQLLRLQVQLGAPAGTAGNRVLVASLNDIDRRILRESLRAARRLQQRLQLDYER
jgi:CBS domain-containing protein